MRQEHEKDYGRSASGVRETKVACRERISQTWFIGSRSGDLAGKSMTSIPSSSTPFVTTLALCARASFRIKRKKNDLLHQHTAYCMIVGSCLDISRLSGCTLGSNLLLQESRNLQSVSSSKHYLNIDEPNQFDYSLSVKGGSKLFMPG